MKFSRRLMGVLIIAGLLLVLLAADDYQVKNFLPLDIEEDIHISKDTIKIWYTDIELSEYIQSAAVAFSEKPENRHVRIMPVLVSALEYLENINRASVNGDGPDLFVVAHDNFEKAYLAGLADVAADEYFSLMRAEYPQAGIDAATYKNKILGYPFYFETSALLYNRTHLEEMVRMKIETDADEAAAEQAMLDLLEHGPEDEISDTPAYLEDVERLKNDLVYVENQVAKLMPKTFEDLKDFAQDYDAPMGVEGLLKWDVNDVFYNYFFIGDAISVGGPSGDDSAKIDIYNHDAIRSMRMYQELNRFFAIDTSEVKYREIINEFIEGKLVYTIATTDVIAKLEEAVKAGDFIYEYGVFRTPDIDVDTPTRSLSMVNCVAINGYSDLKSDANRFAVFLTGEFAGNLYARTGKVPAATGNVPDNEHLRVFSDEFARSIPLPKMIETSNFWIWLEITFARIWEGADANEQLRKLSEQIMSQVTGAPYSEEIIVEIIEEEEIEYFDEAELTREAMQ
ncbi:MAG: extracellular solute-binding protein [Lachnospiraceae bacterium]|nr:extracellular solute-binding protein [Lachnospiraceae bacterium]